MLSSSLFTTSSPPILPPPSQSHGFKPSATPSPACSFTAPNGSLNSATYGSLLDSCVSAYPGKQIHAHSLKNGFLIGGATDNAFVQTKLVQMYARCGHVDDAVQVFEEMNVRSLYAWIAIVNMFLDVGFFEEALSCFQDLLLEDVELEFFVFPVALKICSGGYGGAGLGAQLHGTVLKRGFTSNFYVGNALIDMYGKCGRLEDAKTVFDLLLERDCVSWNSIIKACTTNGMVNEALELLQRMSSGEDNVAPTVVSWTAVIGGLAQNGYDEEAIVMLYRMLAAGFKPNAQTLASILPSCARMQSLGLGKEIHGYLFRHLFMHNSFVVNGLVDLYRRCREMESARNLFLVFSTKNEVSYTTMIAGYFETGEISKAEELFNRMDLEGKRDVINSWNSMISGYVSNKMMDKALTLFRDLVSKGIVANSYTLGSVLTAIADMASSRNGKEVHSYAIVRGMQSDTFVGGALVEMYCKCKDLKAAQRAFDEVTERDTPTWNVLISGYAHLNANQESINCLLQKMKEDGFDPNVYTWNGIIAGHVENDNNEIALQLFLDMQSSTNIRPDMYTIGIILPVCSRLATIDRGMQAHAFAIKRGFESEPHVGVALLDMYAKGGNLKYSKRLYGRIQNLNLVTENAMLSAYATHGQGEEGITFFRRLLDNGFRPDGVTFLSALSCCVHAGSVEEGQKCYNMMAYYDVKPTVKHYTCLVDLLSRAGLLQEAYKVISEMPMKPDSVIWGALLGGCVLHGNIEIGELAADNLIALEPNNTANHVMLGNLYASAGRWHDLARKRQQMTELKMRKNPGCSWIEDKDGIHVFLASDKSHPQSNEIYNILDKLTVHISVYPE